MADQLPERRRSALLRRVDWRFLLDQEAEPRSVCFASGRLAEAVELISAPDGPDTSEGADLAVLVNPRARRLRTASQMLRPGGELYAEWYVPVLGTPGRVRRRLESAGFTNVRCYWPWPWPDRGQTQFWLPLDSPEAIESFLRSRSVGRRKVVLRAAWRLVNRFRLLVPVCATAVKPGGPAAPLQHAVRERLALDGALEQVSWLLLTGGFRSINKAVGLAVSDADPDRRLVVKFARGEAEEQSLRHEADALARLERERPALGGVPRALSLGRRSGRLGLVESEVGGTILTSRLDRETYADLATRVTLWLVELAGSGGPHSRAGWWKRLVETPVAWFEQTFAQVATERELTTARAILSSLPDLPLVFEHRDCSPWNVLVGDRGEPALVDWESAEPSGLPGLDLVYFLTQSAFLVEDALAPGRTSEAYARTLDPRTPTGAVVRSCEERYLGDLGLSAGAMRPLRLLCWVVHSRSEQRHLELDTGAPPSANALRDSVFFGLWKEDVRRAAAGSSQRS